MRDYILEKPTPPYRLALYTAALLLYALTEHINRDQQREQRKNPSRYGDEIVILHAITLFRIAESGRAAVQVLLTTQIGYHICRWMTRKTSSQKCKIALTFLRAYFIL